MKRKTLLQALCSAVSIPQQEGVPEWVHLLPAGAVRTNDGRGPYAVKALQAIATTSLPDGKRLPIDECHVMDKGQSIGLPGPARGWIVEMQARDDGLWGRVEWTPTGKQLMEEKAYIGLSPVILHTQQGEVLQVLRASLTNLPNLQGLVSLHSEETQMDWKAKLIELLGLGSEADDAAIEAALKAKMEAVVQTEHSQNLLQHPTVVALQSQLTDVTGQLNAIRKEGQRSAATAFVDAAIAAGRVGVKPLRDDYISMHMQDPERARRMIEAQPAIGGTSATGANPGEVRDEGGLSQADRQVIALMGLNEDEYRARLEAAGQKKEAL